MYKMKATKHCWKKLKKTQIYGNKSYAHGLEDLILLRCQYYPKLSTDSVQPYQSPNDIVCRNGKIHPKIRMKSQGTPNSQSQKRIKLGDSNFLILKLSRILK